MYLCFNSSSLNFSRNCEYQNCNYICYKDNIEEKIDESENCADSLTN